MIFKGKVSRRVSWVGVVSIGLLALIVLPGWTSGQTESSEAIQEAGTEAPATGSEEKPASSPATESNKPSPFDDGYAFSEAEQSAPGSVARAGTSAQRRSRRPAQAGAATKALPSYGEGEAGGFGDYYGMMQEDSEGEAGGYMEGTAYMGGAMPGMATARRRAAKPIEVFRLKHRSPAEMLEIVTVLFRLVTREDGLPAGDVTVLAVIKAPAPGYGSRYGGGGMPYSSGMGAPTPGMPYGPGMPSGGPMMMPSGYQPGMGYDEEADEAYYLGVAKRRRPPELRLTVDDRTKALIARGSKEAMETARSLITALDTPDDNLAGQFEKLQNLRLIRFQHRRTEEMIRVLQGLGIHVQVTQVPYRADEAQAAFVGQRGGVLIAAGPEADLKEIEKLIQALDVEGKRPAAKGYPEMEGYEGVMGEGVMGYAEEYSEDEGTDSYRGSRGGGGRGRR